MSIPLVINGVTYDYPEVDDTDWGPDATDWASAVTGGMLQKAGGTFQLLAEVDFGTSFGLKSLYYKSRTSNVADAGQIRLARADVINFRNQANDGNLSLGVSASDTLQFDGVDILTVALTAAQILVGSASNIATAVTMSGDATLSNIGALTIANSAVTNAKMANMAESTIKGRAASSGSGAPVDLTATQATAILNDFVGDSGSGGTKGLVPAPQAGDAAAEKFLKADGTWTTPPGSGDVVGPASSTDSGFARFDGTTGKLLKNSAATIVNADVASNAAIARSKLGAGTANYVVINDGSGNFSEEAALAISRGGTGQATKSAAFDSLSPMTTGGDLIYGGASGTGTRLANGSSGQYLMSAGGTSAPTWATFDSSTVQVFTSGGTWNKPAGLIWAAVTVIGGGGGSGAVDGQGSNNASAGVGGGGGGGSFKIIAAASLGSSESVTVGAGGTAGTAGGPADGGTGGTSSFGAHCSATGGAGGATDSTGTTASVPTVSAGAAGGVGSGGDINAYGSPGGWGFRAITVGVGGAGGASAFGFGGGGLPARASSAAATGNSPTGGYGGGGGGAASGNTTNNALGADGATGIVIVQQFFA